MSFTAKFKSTAAAFRRSSITLGRDIDGLRQEVVRLHGERDRVAALPITKAMAIERLDLATALPSMARSVLRCSLGPRRQSLRPEWLLVI